MHRGGRGEHGVMVYLKYHNPNYRPNSNQVHEVDQDFEVHSRSVFFFIKSLSYLRVLRALCGEILRVDSCAIDPLLLGFCYDPISYCPWFRGRFYHCV